MLAQAQEVFYLKAVKDKMKDQTISKLAAQCSDFYAEAMKSIQVDFLKDVQKVCLILKMQQKKILTILTIFLKAMDANNIW